MAITNWFTPGTQANVDRDGKEPWASTEKAATENDDGATNPTHKETYSDWLRLTNYGLDGGGGLPEGATVVGIEVKVRRKDAHMDTVHNESALYLRKTAGQVGDNKASATLWDTTWTDATHGDSTDTWNAGLADTDIRSADFGVDLSVYNTDASDIDRALVDVISIRIHYTEEVVGWAGGDVNGVAIAAIAKINGVALADILKVNGV